MAWRFRRSTKIGPFRITATKNGLSASAGVPGARVSVNSKGQVRRTVGIPGSGLYDTELVNPKPSTVRAHARKEQEAQEQQEAQFEDQTPDVSAATGQHDRTEPQPRRWGAATTLLVAVMASIIIVQTIILASR